MMTINNLLQKIYNIDFSKITSSENFNKEFFAKTLTISELKLIFEFVQSSLLLKGSENCDAPFMVIAQLHGNEPAGLAGFALAMALKESGFLKKDVVCVIGNPLAGKQYFEAYTQAPDAPQETRDAFRCGITENGDLLPDGNRIPIDFLTTPEVSNHVTRSRELFAIAQKSCGVLDIHSARGNMVCITDHKHDSDLKYSPIRAILTELAEAISANASKSVTVRTLKTILEPLPNIKCQIGIEAGKHEDRNSPQIAASFTLSTFYNLDITDVLPLNPQDDGKFTRYSVQPRITYADLIIDGELQVGDMVFMAKEIEGKIEEYQYDEMMEIKSGQIVAIAKPSGVLLRAKSDFSGIFFSKSAKLYDKDPAVGPWPVPAHTIDSIKFCYPCLLSEIKLELYSSHFKLHR